MGKSGVAKEKRLIETIHHWAELGRVFSALRPKRKASWKSVNRMIDATRTVRLAESAKLRHVLLESNNRLAPLTDPLLSNFDLRRWLAEEREEVYSDWLEWVVKQLPTLGDVFYVLGIAEPEEIASQALSTFSTKREMLVKLAHWQSWKRLDLVIRCEGRVLVLIEVKKTSAEQADTAKQEEYFEWGKQEPERHKYFVLLAKGGERPKYYEFQLRTFEDLCRALRKRAPELIREGNMTVPTGALVLAYVGAVEQNLLGLSSGTARRVFNGEDVATGGSLVLYLEDLLEGATTMNKDTNLNLFQDGLQSYPDALVAIKEFCREVLSRSRRILEANLDNLGQALHSELDSHSISDYVWPNWPPPVTWDGTSAWIAAKLPVGDLCGVYLGLLWPAEGGKPSRPGIAVDFELYQKPVFNTLSKKFRSLAGERIQLPYHWELMMWEPLDPANAVSFGEKLDSILKEWIKLWSQIPPTDYQTPPQDH